jgi:predicted TIM-barrel fold metal-dependent hydrolase
MAGFEQTATMTEIVDAHQHVGSLLDALSWTGHSPPPAVPVEQDAVRRVALMDKAGVDWAVLQPGHGYARADGLAATMRVNDEMAQYKRLAPERFRAVLGTLEPLYGEQGLPEIDRCKTTGIDGLAWHHRFQGCYIDSRWMWPILERMQALSLTPAIHVNAESSLEAPWRLQRLAREFPELTFLAFDGFWSYERARQILEEASQTPNVIWDIGGPALYVGLEEWVRRNGSETICFSAELGYEASETQRPKQLPTVERAKINDRDRENILGGNMQRLFRRG